jgi:hypothetical protein
MTGKLRILFPLSVALVGVGMFVAQLTFRQMSWQLNPFEGWRDMLAALWVTPSRSKRVLQAHQAAYGDSKLRLVNKMAGIFVIVGFLGVLGSAISLYVAITH